MILESEKKKLPLFIKKLDVELHVGYRGTAKGGVELYVVDIGGEIEKEKYQKVSFEVYLTEPRDPGFVRIQAPSSLEKSPRLLMSVNEIMEGSALVWKGQSDPNFGTFPTGWKAYDTGKQAISEPAQKDSWVCVPKTDKFSSPYTSNKMTVVDAMKFYNDLGNWEKVYYLPFESKKVGE